MPPKFSYEDTSAFLYRHPAMTLRCPPCQAVCPAGVPVSLMNRLLAEGHKEQALALLLDITPFPDSMCEHCAKPCESACNKKRHTSVPVPVARLTRLAASCLPDADPPCAKDTGFKVAVAGRGAFALAAAYFLRRLGHAVTVMATEPDPQTARVTDYLVAHGVEFCTAVPDAQTLEAQFSVVLSEDGDATSDRCLPLGKVTDNTVAWIREARRTACEVDSRLYGCTLNDMAWIRILPDGEVERERLPRNFPEDAKPVTVVRYEDLNNTAWYEDRITFRERLACLESLEEQAMECFHCGKCTGCGTCVNVCPGDVLAMKDGKPYVRYPDECIHCSACMLDCPSGAIFFRLPLPATLGAPMKYLA